MSIGDRVIHQPTMHEGTVLWESSGRVMVVYDLTPSEMKDARKEELILLS